MSVLAPAAGLRKVYYGWYIAMAGSASNFFVLGIAVIGFGVFIEPIRQEFGWSARTIALGFSIRSFEQGLMSPVTGYLVDRLGPRKMALTGVTILSLGLLMFSQTHEVWFYYLSAMTISLGQSLGAMNPFSLALMNWFYRKRGQAIGLLNTGNAAGYFIVPVMAFLVVTFGWRETLIITAAVTFAAGIPLALVLRTHPEPYGYLPDGGRIEDQSSAPAPLTSEVQPVHMVESYGSGMSVSEALHTPVFYLLVLVGGASSLAMSTWVTFSIPHLLTSGFSLGATGVIVMIYGVVQVVARYGTGWLGDKFGRRRLYIWSFLLQAIGLFIFANISPSLVWLLPFYYLTFALGHASWTVGQATIIADYFGTKRFATIRGLGSTMRMPIGIVGPYFAGWIFDTRGSYDLAYMLLALGSSTGILFLLMIRRPYWGETTA